MDDQGLYNEDARKTTRWVMVGKVEHGRCLQRVAEVITLWGDFVRRCSQLRQMRAP